MPLGSILATLAVVELGLRLFFPQPLHPTESFLADGWQTAREGAMGHIPNAVGRVTRAEFDVAVKINSLGLREREIPYERTDEVYRILVLGDSQTFGFGVEAEETYARLLEQRLSARAANGKRLRVQTLNAGVIGTGTAHQLYYLQEQGWRFQPDAVVVGFFFNDLIENTQCRLFGLRGDQLIQTARATGGQSLIHEAYHRDRSHEDVQTVTAPAPIRPARVSWLVRRFHLARLLRDRLSSLIQSRAGNAAADPVTRPAMKLTLKLYEELARQCREHHAALLVALIPRPEQCADPGLKSLREEYRAAFAALPEKPSQGVGVVDLLQPLRAAGGSSLFFPIDRHLNVRGHRATAAAIAEALPAVDPRLTARGRR